MGAKANRWTDPLLPFKAELDAILDEYFITLGDNGSANQFYSAKEISNNTYELYLQMFFGDLARLQREEGTAKKVMSSILRHLQSHIGWQNIAKETALPSVITIAHYADVLQNLFVLNIYHAFDQNKRQPKYRSEKNFKYQTLSFSMHSVDA